jgi:hypothetical protein
MIKYFPSCTVTNILHIYSNIIHLGMVMVNKITRDTIIVLQGMGQFKPGSAADTKLSKAYSNSFRIFFWEVRFFFLLFCVSCPWLSCQNRIIPVFKETQMSNWFFFFHCRFVRLLYTN